MYVLIKKINDNSRGNDSEKKEKKRRNGMIIDRSDKGNRRGIGKNEMRFRKL